MDEKYLGYIKYEGNLVENGYLDARHSAQVLIGIDEVLRYFLCQIDEKLQQVDFEIPVRIRKGSWEALIPDNIQQWIMAAGGSGITVYFASALNKMAENDVGDKGFKDVLKKAFKAIKWVVKIACHIRSLTLKQFSETKFREEDGQNLVGITNHLDETLYVPFEYLEFYKNCPEKLFDFLTKGIEPDRHLVIGLNEEEPLDKDDKFRYIEITYHDKYIFTKEEEPNEILFPELKHNQYVEIEGHVTRGNENSNTIGFEYLRHILTCTPVHGNIKEQKDLLFLNCLMKGYVDRLDKDGTFNEKRPRIKYIELVEIADQGEQLNLFPEIS